jgi:hypothetical protein
MTASLEFVTLNDSEAKAVLTNHVELRPDGEVIAVAVPADLAPEVQAVLRSLADSPDAGRAARLLIEHLTPQRPLSRGAVLQAHRNSVARDALASRVRVARATGRRWPPRCGRRTWTAPRRRCSRLRWNASTGCS